MATYDLFSSQKLLDNEPKTYGEAIKSKQAVHWKKVMDKETKSLYDNETWSLVSIPTNQKVIECKWIYKVKEGLTNS